MSIFDSIGNFFGKLGEDKSTTRTRLPDWINADATRNILEYAQLAAPEHYGGMINAPINRNLARALASLGANTNQKTYRRKMANLGQLGTQSANRYSNYLTQLRRRGGPQFQYDQGTYDQAFNNLTGGLQSAFDLGAQNLQRNFDWNALPGLNMSAALSGGSGNTGAFRQSALGQAMTDQNIRQFGTDLFQNAAGQANANAMTAGAANLNADMTNVGNILGGYGNLANLALPGWQGAFNAQQGIAQNQLTSGMGQLNLVQSNLDRKRDQYYFDDNRIRQFERQQAMDMLGVNNSLGETVGRNRGSPLEIGGQIAGIGGAIASGGGLGSILGGISGALGGGGSTPSAATMSPAVQAGGGQPVGSLYQSPQAFTNSLVSGINMMPMQFNNPFQPIPMPNLNFNAFG
jgi:hypothetical protein